MDNLPILILLGGLGIIITIYLWITGKKTHKEEQIDNDFDYITIFKISFTVISLIYLFRLVMMFFTGVLSGFYLLSIVGAIIAFLPLIAMSFVRYNKKIKLKV